jgi:transglutaminase-like putative cysteine protease
MIDRLMRMIGWRALANLILLLTLVGLLGWELSSVVRGFQPNMISGIIILGIGVGIVLARTHLSGSLTALISVLAGLISAVFHFARLSGPLLAMLRVFRSIPNALLQEHTWPDLSPLVLAWHQFLSQLSTMITQIMVWITAFFQGKSGVDPIVISLLWGLALWFIIIWAAWGIFRLHVPVLAVTPAGILLAGILNFTRGNAIILVPFVAAILLLMSLNRYEVEEQYWKKNRIDYAEDIRLDMITVIPLLVIGLAIVAYITPSFSVRRIIQLVRQISEPYQSQTQSLAESLGIEQQPASSAALEVLRSPGLPQQHLLGSGPELSHQVVMVIHTGDLSPFSPAELFPQPPVQYYWRALTYDMYTGRGWATSTTESIQYSAGQPALADIPSDNPAIHMVEQSVLFAQDIPGIVYASGMLITADVDFEVSWRIPSEDTADAFGVASQARNYNASSLLTTPSIEQMRNALPVYPEWVLERYLTLPENLPQRVSNLALELTRDQPTKYDQATAIETYLRSYPYSLDVPKPPDSQDVADYFLFELKRGYCDYYATAMVVLSRAAGLPARLVSGYASGTYDAPNARYVVTADNAHSWVEIYFSGIGWVEFEPTGGLPTIIRRTDQTGLPADISDPRPVHYFNLFRWLTGTSLMLWISISISILILAVALWYIIDLWRLRRLPSQPMLSQIYHRLKLHGEKLAIGRQSGDTPYEFGARLGASFNDLTSRVIFQSLLSPASREIEKLVQLCAQAFYSPHPLSSTGHLEAVKTWVRLSWRLWVLRLIRRTSRIKITSK